MSDIGHIDNYDNLLEELPSYSDCTNQLVSRPKEEYRWIRERLVWGWDYTKLTRAYAKEFKRELSQAAWTVKAEVGRLVTKIQSYMLNSTSSEIIAFSRIDSIYEAAIRNGDIKLALDAMREMNTMTFRHKAKFKAPPAQAGNKPAKEKPAKLTPQEKKTRQAVRTAVKQATRVAAETAEEAAKQALVLNLNNSDLASMTDEELLRRIRNRQLTDNGVVVKQDQFGNTVPVISSELAMQLTGN